MDRVGPCLPGWVGKDSAPLLPLVSTIASFYQQIGFTGGQWNPQILLTGRFGWGEANYLYLTSEGRDGTPLGL